MPSSDPLGERGRQSAAECTAASLNTSLKSAFKTVGRWGFEATVADGVIRDAESTATTREGFDLARYDIASNVGRFWSACNGRRPLVGGDKAWRRELARRPAWAAAASAKSAELAVGLDATIDPTEPTIFGDVQFGNWALAYRDLMRLLDADIQLDVDLYVYITGDETLSSQLSEGIVTFEYFTAVLAQFANLLKVPIWVVGLGLEE